MQQGAAEVPVNLDAIANGLDSARLGLASLETSQNDSEPMSGVAAATRSPM
jgi:hypothetical protein